MLLSRLQGWYTPTLSQLHSASLAQSFSNALVHLLHGHRSKIVPFCYSLASLRSHNVQLAYCYMCPGQQAA